MFQFLLAFALANLGSLFASEFCASSKITQTFSRHSSIPANLTIDIHSFLKKNYFNFILILIDFNVFVVYG